MSLLTGKSVIVSWDFSDMSKAALAKAIDIVIPSHGYTGLSHLFLGSVAERVVRLAHCPLLVLRS